MAIVSVRTELIQSNVANQNSGIKTHLTWTMDNGTSSGESSALAIRSATGFVVKYMNSISNIAAAREITRVTNQYPLK